MTLNIFKTIQRFRKNRKGFSLIEISVVILIIGVLIAGISQASDMIDEAALKGARAASKGSRVGRIKDLVLWIDAVSDGGSLTEASKQAVDADPVTQLKDMNPRSSAKLKLTGTSFFSSNKVSGLPGLVFNGSSHFFKLADRFDNSTGEYTIYLVYQPVAIPASGSHVIFEKRNITQTLPFPYKLELDSTGFYKFSDSNGSLFGAKKASTGKVNLIKLTRSSAGKLEIFVDDVIKSGSDNSTSVVNSFELTIGAQNGTPLSKYANGRIGELIIFERDLATAEKADIEAYLFKKWKIEKDATKASTCAVTGDANALGSMEVGASLYACKPGYAFVQGGTAPTCLAAPALTFAKGTAACLGCVVPTSANFTTSPTIPLSGSAVTLTCKFGGTTRSVTCPTANTPTFTPACPAS
jgi:prepilin-type N-terminal cleavage/methylation domain-containing protein